MTTTAHVSRTKFQVRIKINHRIKHFSQDWPDLNLVDLDGIQLIPTKIELVLADVSYFFLDRKGLIMTKSNWCTYRLQREVKVEKVEVYKNLVKLTTLMLY